MDDFPQVFKNDLFHNYMTDIVHGAFGSVAPIILTEIIVFLYRFTDSAVETQLSSTVCTVEQPREHRHFPHPGRTPFACSDFLDNLKSFPVNDCLMGSFKDFPLIRGMLDFLMALIRLVMCLKIYRMSQIIRSFQNRCNCRGVPCKLVCRKYSPWLSAFLQCVIGRAEDFPLRQDMGDLRRTIAADAQPEDFPYHFGGFFVHDPLLFVLRVLHVPVGRM